MSTGYKFLALAILSEIVATRWLKGSDGLTKLWPGLLALAYINLAYICLARTLKEDVPLAIAYGIWSGVGIVIISIIDVIFGQRLDTAAIVGLALIVVGVVVVNFSNSVLE